MEARSSKLNRKRQREQENRPCAEQKSQRLLDKLQSPSNASNEPVEPVEPMKITDLNDFCLQKIFEHLDLSSLFNVAVANEWLRPAANDVFKRKFGKKTVLISSYRFHAPFITPTHNISVNGLKLCLQFLRCLGLSINDLNILYHHWNRERCKYIQQYVNKYCAESLVAIKFSGKPTSIPIGPFEKPFVNVRTVEVYSSNLHNQWPSFAEWFPNMRSLKWIDVQTKSRIDLSEFDHLNDLSIFVSNNGGNSTMNEATHLIQQLPHLHSLNIWGYGFTWDALLESIKNNCDICNLKVNMFQFTSDATVFNVQQFINEHPLLIELEIMGLNLAFDTIIPLISQLSALKHFRFQMVNRLEYDRLVSQLDSKWRSTFSDSGSASFMQCVVQLER